MPLQIGPDEPHPTHFWNKDDLQLRLQCFVIVRDDEGRVACVREKERPQVWNLPGETVPPDTDVRGFSRDVSELWFVEPLETRPLDVLTWTTDEPGVDKWYITFLFEADAPEDGLDKPDDTEEIRFFALDEPPAEFAMDHGSIFEALKRSTGR